MKRGSLLTILTLVSFLLASLVIAQNSSNNTSTQQQDLSKTEEGFICLEEKVGDCNGLTTQEIALTILAGPKQSTFDDCVDELKSRESGNNWGNVRDTALAILALDHAGEDTTESEEWLLTQTRTPTDLIWYVEQDSNQETTCTIDYNYNGNANAGGTITVNEDKRISSNAGTCLTRAQSNFWLKVNPVCYDTEFVVSCDKDFIATLLYKNQNSPTIYVLEGTEASPAFGSINLKVNSKCFGGSSCDYEGTAWAVIALLKTGHVVEEYIPYLIALSDTNEEVLPEAFIYMATNYEDYASELVSDVKLGNYWLATRSKYNKFYDTALALISLGSSSSDQIVKSKDWLLFSQGTNGCWQNSVRETAIVLWALEGRTRRTSSTGSGTTTTGGVTYCTEANYFCIPTAECPGAQNVGNNYFCPSLSETCCTAQNLKTCSELNGKVCTGDTVCSGNERAASDSPKCCTGECVERPKLNECEANFLVCLDSCSDTQESASYSCDAGQVCCRTKINSSGSDSGGSKWWIWLLIILIILLVLAIIGWIYRRQIRAWWNNRKNKGKKDGSSSSPSQPGVPPRPSPPMPMRRMGPPPMPVRRPSPVVAPGVNPVSQRSYDRRNPEMTDTFRRLRNMSG